MKVKIRRLNHLETAAVRTIRRRQNQNEQIAAAQVDIAATDNRFVINKWTGEIAAFVKHPAAIRSVWYDADSMPHVAAIEAVAAMCGVSADDMAGEIIPAIRSAIAAGISQSIMSAIIELTAADDDAIAASEELYDTLLDRYLRRQ